MRSKTYMSKINLQCGKLTVENRKSREKRELLDTVKAMKLAFYGHTMRKQGSCLEKEITQGTMPGARRRGRRGQSE